MFLDPGSSGEQGPWDNIIIPLLCTLAVLSSEQVHKEFLMSSISEVPEIRNQWVTDHSSFCSRICFALKCLRFHFIWFQLANSLETITDSLVSLLLGGLVLDIISGLGFKVLLLLLCPVSNSLLLSSTWCGPPERLPWFLEASLAPLAPLAPHAYAHQPDQTPSLGPTP